MQTYKLINNTTKEEIICSLVTIDGFDYYVSDTYINTLNPDDKYHTIVENRRRIVQYSKHIQSKDRVVIATNNPNIDIPKVIDEVDNIIKNAFYDKKGDFKRSTIGADDWINGLKLGYNKAKETYQFTEEDMIEFTEWCQKPSLEDLRQQNVVYIPSSNFYWYKHNKYSPKELLDIWKEQQPKPIFYE